MTIVGNAFVDNMVHSTLGYVFGGNADWKGIGSAIKGFFVADNKNFGDSVAHTLGNVAAVYLLGNTTVANKAGNVTLTGSPDKKWKDSERYVKDADGNFVKQIWG